MKKRIIISIVILLALLEFTHYFFDSYFMNKWQQRFLTEPGSIELKAKYPETTLVKLAEYPNTQWCYIEGGNYSPLFFLPFLSRHEKIIFKDEQGNILSFWRGPTTISFNLNQVSTDIILNLCQAAAEENSTSISQELSTYFKKKGFKEYSLSKDKK